MITYRQVYEWTCPMCGACNYTPAVDVDEDGVLLCWKCTEEYEEFQEESEDVQ